MATVAASDTDHYDLAAVAAQLDVSADRVRRALHRRPDLAARCPVLWGRRLFPATIVGEIRAEVQSSTLNNPARGKARVTRG